MEIDRCFAPIFSYSGVAKIDLANEHLHLASHYGSGCGRVVSFVDPVDLFLVLWLGKSGENWSTSSVLNDC